VCELDLLTTAVDKIVLSQQYGIHSWLERAYMDVCTADGWLSDEDGLRLGVAAVLRIGRARHELRMPAALKPESSRLDIVREICSLATTVVSPATTLACNLGSELVLTDASSGDAAEPTPPPSADPDSESVKVSGHRLGAGIELLSVTHYLIGGFEVIRREHAWLER
jgi:hypothetical protein